MLKPAEEVLQDLIRESNFSVHSDSELVGDVAKAAEKEDEERAKKQAEKSDKDKDNTLRRKPGLRPLPELQSIAITPWEVLHVLGRAIGLARRGAARGLAEHWGALKYSQALTGDSGTFMHLSEEGKATAEYYKAIQSRELGTGFALATARRFLKDRYPDRFVSIVPADTVLQAGWSKLGTYKPQYFAELWKPGKHSLVFPISCKGNHGDIKQSQSQLASASAHVEMVHIGPWNETPVLIFSTEIPPEGYVTVHALCAQGGGGWLKREHVKPGDLDKELSDENYFPRLQVPSEVEESLPHSFGFHVTPERYGWFGRVLARTAAAGVTAFAGNSEATAQYLTKRQGKQHFEGFAHAGSGSVQARSIGWISIPVQPPSSRMACTRWLSPKANCPGAPGCRGGRLDSSGAAARSAVVMNGFSAALRQAMQWSVASGVAAWRRFAKARTGSLKNITPRRDTMLSKLAGAKA